MSEKRSFLPHLAVALRLTVISAAVVLLISGVNYFTKDRIAENVQKKTDAAMAELFPEGEVGITSFQLTEKEKACVTEIYSVKNDGYITGYCIAVKANGFGGEISLIVGVTSGSKIAGVKFISHSETPSVGAPVLSDGGLLNGFANLYTTAVGSVDSVSGATLTSDAVKEAVKTAADLAERIISENG